MFIALLKELLCLFALYRRYNIVLVKITQLGVIESGEIAFKGLKKTPQD